jgi:hypothetical protein
LRETVNFGSRAVRHSQPSAGRTRQLRPDQPAVAVGRYGLEATRELPALRARDETAARHELQNKPKFFTERAEPFAPFRQ